MMNGRQIARVAHENAFKLVASVVLTLQSPLSWAQPAESETYPYGAHMMWGGGWLGMFFGILFMVLLLAAVIGGIALVARWFSAPRYDAQPPQHSGRTPLDILKERYARGEIDKEEFDERRRALSE